jgi:hypothetical protein
VASLGLFAGAALAFVYDDVRLGSLLLGAALVLAVTAAMKRLHDLIERLERSNRHTGAVGARMSRLYRSPHHLFEDLSTLHPRSSKRVDAILYAAELHLLLLDPASPLVDQHRLALEPDSNPDYVRSKMREALEELGPYATVRLFNAQAPGILLIVDDHIIWGPVPSVPSDVPLPLLELKVDTHEHTYWAFRRNFDALWDHARAPLAVARSN